MPIYLPKSKGWLIKRQIPGTNFFDAMGPYPLFFCEEWELLIEDLEELKHELVCCYFVVGPFTKYPAIEYQVYFDKFYPYKDHFLLDLSLPFDKTISKKRRKDARRALRFVSVDLVEAPNINLDEWYSLYNNLIDRHNITGIRAFSRESFRQQIDIPRTHFFRAKYNGEVVGGSLYYIQENTVYFHLSAFLDKGYELDAAYAVKWTALNYFSDKVQWMNLGGGISESMSGLDQFKRGWSNTNAKSFFCAKILNPQIYNELVTKKEITNPEWFPLYRSGDY